MDYYTQHCLTIGLFGIALSDHWTIGQRTVRPYVSWTLSKTAIGEFDSAFTNHWTVGHSTVKPLDSLTQHYRTFGKLDTGLSDHWTFYMKGVGGWPHSKKIEDLFCLSLKIFKEGWGMLTDSKDDEEFFFCLGLNTFKRKCGRINKIQTLWGTVIHRKQSFIKVPIRILKYRGRGGGQSRLEKIPNRSRFSLGMAFLSHPLVPTALWRPHAQTVKDSYSN